jgi:DNA replicative helicase MCM subunit Mcm2 (Cdc46/Mcm family)
MSDQIYSVSDAIRIQGGKIWVTGMIASVSTSYKIISKSRWICKNPNGNLYGGQDYYPYLLLPPLKLDNTTGTRVRCWKCESDLFTVTHEYKNARTIQVENSDKSENNDRLEVLLFDNASSNVVAGENVNIFGEVFVQRRIEGGKGKKLITTLHSDQITYKNKQNIIITHNDIKIFHKWKHICNLAYQKEVESKSRNESWSKKIIPMNFVERVTKMFAPNVIGHEESKLGILLSVVGGRHDHDNDSGRRGRINTQENLQKFFLIPDMSRHRMRVEKVL